MDKIHKLFISHSSRDADYVEAFVGLLEILGLKDEEIICSSIPPYCVPLGNKVYDWLVNEFQHSNLHVVYTFSKDYYASAASLNEMGAAWAMKHRWTGLLLPGFSFDRLDGCIDKTQISIKLDDPDSRTLKYRLSEFKDELIKEFTLCPIPEAKWERHRDVFLDEIKDIAEKRIQEGKEIQENNDLNTYRYKSLYNMLLKWNEYDTLVEIKDKNPSEIAADRIVHSFIDNQRRLQIISPLIDEKYKTNISKLNEEGQKLLGELIEIENKLDEKYSEALMKKHKNLFQQFKSIVSDFCNEIEKAVHLQLQELLRVQ